MINIFAKPAFLNTASNVPFISKEVSYKGNGHLQRVSSMIRSDQIVEYLKDEAKLNPTSWNKDDISIYVKPHIRPGNDFEFVTKNSWIDIIDGWGLIPLLERHPEVGVIACSTQDGEKLAKVLKNRIMVIPQHHCNYDRLKRNSKKIETVGIIGTESAFAFIPEGLEEELTKRNIKLLKYSKFFSRQDIINFYMQIDVQLVWRPYRMKLSNPLKIVNAASFGIPTIAYDEEVFKEVENCYVGVKTVNEILFGLDTQKDVLQYMSEICFKKAEDYHISEIAKLYKLL